MCFLWHTYVLSFAFANITAATTSPPTEQPKPRILALNHHQTSKMSSQSITTDLKVKFELPSLISCPITLSRVHLEIAADELVKYPVTVLEIPATGTTPVVHFNAILQKTTNSCLMVESFYNEFPTWKHVEINNLTRFRSSEKLQGRNFIPKYRG